MKLVPIRQDLFEEYRLTLMFECYKWDPQFLDKGTIAPYALVLTQDEHEEVARLTEALDRETRAAEEFLNKHLELTKPLALPRSLKKEIHSMNNYNPGHHIRLMRYDFHPIDKGGWAISEVNSDVPGGFAEGSLMPKAVLDFLDEEKESYWHINFGKRLIEAIENKVVAGGRIMLVHCTCYSDDRQVMQFIGDQLKKKGFHTLYAAADHLVFKDKKAISILDGNEGEVDAIIRFTPLEWVVDMRPKNWRGYFDTTTVSCNHPIAIFAQTKRFPFVFDALEKRGISMSTWRRLLPKTLEVKDAKGKEGYIYKPIYGRVGEMIGIPEACRKEEYKAILSEVKRSPKTYLAQKRFFSRPLKGNNDKVFHLCLGSYTVDGSHAGYYARISETPRIDSEAADLPVLIEREGRNL